MTLIITLVIIAIILYLFNVIWPLFLFLAIIFVIWKIYELYYYKSSKFIEIKRRITTYIDNCNGLNRHIEDLKYTELVSHRKDYGNALYRDSSKWNYERKHLKNQQYAPNIHNCSRTVCDNARKKPFEYICKYFGIKATEETLSKFESILNNFEAAEEGKKHLLNEKKKILESIHTNIPTLIRKFSKSNLEKILVLNR